MTNSLVTLPFLRIAKKEQFPVASGLQYEVFGDHIWLCLGWPQLPVAVNYSGHGSPRRKQPPDPDLLLTLAFTQGSFRSFRLQCPHLSNQVDDAHPLYLPHFLMEILRPWGSNKSVDRKCFEKHNVLHECSGESSLSLCYCHYYFVVSSAFLNAEQLMKWQLYWFLTRREKGPNEALFLSHFSIQFLFFFFHNSYD